jgi:hypothetical protein
MAATPEGKVKAHLKKRVAEYGGELLFVRYIGRNGCFDTRMRFRGGRAWVEKTRQYVENGWIELKAKDANGTLSTGQEKELDRLSQYGEQAYVLNSIEAIDQLLPAP